MPGLNAKAVIRLFINHSVLYWFMPETYCNLNECCYNRNSVGEKRISKFIGFTSPVLQSVVRKTYWLNLNEHMAQSHYLTLPFRDKSKLDFISELNPLNVMSTKIINVMLIMLICANHPVILCFQ